MPAERRARSRRPGLRSARPAAGPADGAAAARARASRRASPPDSPVAARANPGGQARPWRRSPRPVAPPAKACQRSRLVGGAGQAQRLGHGARHQGAALRQQRQTGAQVGFGPIGQGRPRPEDLTGGQSDAARQRQKQRRFARPAGPGQGDCFAGAKGQRQAVIRSGCPPGRRRVRSVIAIKLAAVGHGLPDVGRRLRRDRAPTRRAASAMRPRSDTARRRGASVSARARAAKNAKCGKARGQRSPLHRRSARSPRHPRRPAWPAATSASPGPPFGPVQGAAQGQTGGPRRPGRPAICAIKLAIDRQIAPGADQVDQPCAKGLRRHLGPARQGQHAARAAPRDTHSGAQHIAPDHPQRHERGRPAPTAPQAPAAARPLPPEPARPAAGARRPARRYLPSAGSAPARRECADHPGIRGRQMRRQHPQPQAFQRAQRGIMGQDRARHSGQRPGQAPETAPWPRGGRHRTVAPAPANPAAAAAVMNQPDRPKSAAPIASTTALSAAPRSKCAALVAPDELQDGPQMPQAKPPRSMTRSIRAASAGSWVATISVAPRAACGKQPVGHQSGCSTSRSAVGSSARIRSGAERMARASVIRRASPPERPPPVSPSRVVRPRGSACATSATAAICSARRKSPARPRARFCAQAAGQEMRSLRHPAQTRPPRIGIVSAQPLSGNLHLARFCQAQPSNQTQNAGLARTAWPDEGNPLAGLR